ncbi:LacI family DNA-binding transcriptional regulator [Streptomyces avicenniae]|uniref:LacI family DNA-binding transcriptional regulator n=1 Tax=Streptomyces avicenniae TaxID=500153 RepID=UPI00069AD5DB|nr:LacI family DNA-binding transcriptional regulator [Streptomyces avicenniae]
MATIGDVARAAGVSRSTVSYALSGKRAISDETRRRIEHAIAALGFTPNAGAQALATSRTKVIGLMLHFHEDEFAPAVLQYLLPISDTARDLGYDILMVTDEDGPQALRRITQTGMVDGVVLLDVTHDDPRLEPLRASGKPGVLVGLPNDPAGLDVFDLDFAAAARVLLDHLHGLGHRRIILITPAQEVFERGVSYSWRFRDAAVAHAARLGVEVHPHYGENEQPSSGRALRAVLDAHPDATALIVHNDGSAAPLPMTLHGHGVHVPERLSVVSLYSQAFGRAFSLPYTAVDTSPAELGRLAIHQLITRIQDGERAGPHRVHLATPHLTDRASTARV